MSPPRCPCRRRRRSPCRRGDAVHVAQVPLERLHLETDAPWCGVKRTHAGYSHVRPNPAWPEAKKESKWAPGHVVKDRCEPAHIAHVLQVLAAARGDDEAAVAAAATANSERVFFS